MGNNIDYSQLSIIKEKLKVLKELSDTIHVTIHNKRNGVVNASSKIISIHDRFFCVESKINNYVEKFTINYIDLLINLLAVAINIAKLTFVVELLA